MRLVWHIAKKDLRRMAPAEAVWLALLLAAALMMALAKIPEEAVRSSEVHDWLLNLKIAVSCLTGTAMALGVLLMAQLVQEDPWTGQAAMWRTRPIGAGRLWAAKLVAAAGLFIGAPLVVLTPVWLASGFSPAAWLAAAAMFIAWQGAVILIAGSLAALTKDLGAFVFTVVGVVAVVLLAFLPVESVLGQAPDGVKHTRVFLVVPGAALAVMLAGAVHGVTRRTRWAGLTLGLGLVTVVALRLAWPWDSLPERPGIFGRWGAVRPERGADVTVEKLVKPTETERVPKTLVTLTPVDGAGQFTAPWNGHGSAVRADRRGAVGSMEMGRQWGADAMQRVVGLGPKTGAVRWELFWGVGENGVPVTELGEVVRMSGRLRMARMQARVMGELPWQAGAVARDGASLVRIMRVGQLPGSMQHGVVLEERDATPLTGAAARDGYALVNRRLVIFRYLPSVEIGAVTGGALRLAARTLTYEPPTEANDWERDAVLVKVRFEVIERWQAPFVTERVQIVDEEKKS